MLTYQKKNTIPGIFLNYTMALLASWLKKIIIVGNDIKIITSKNNVYNIMNWLIMSTSAQYKQVIDIAVIDRPGKELRFSVIYMFLSHKYTSRVSVSTKTDEITILTSITEIYKSANWFEREVWDLFGIYFDKHTELQQILTDYGFNGHPLRKDFPLTGFIELYFSDDINRWICSYRALAKEFQKLVSYVN